MMDTNKVCPKCKELKNKPCFYKDDSKLDKLSSYCKKCAKEKRMLRYEDNKEKEKESFKQHYQGNKEQYRGYSLKSLYNLSIEDYNDMREDQMFSCLICKTHEDDLSRGLFVDHCHETGKIRGLLCQHCNTILGMAKDNQLILQEAIKYLART